MRNADGRLGSACDLLAQLRSPGRSPSSECHAAEAGHAVLISLRRLNDARRRVIELRFMKGLSHKEIAGKMGRSEAAVNNLLCRGLHQLRGILGDPAKYFRDAPSSDPACPAKSARC